MKKILVLALVLMLICGMSASAATVSGPGEYPIVDEACELNIWAPLDATVEDLETNETTLWYEEKTGVHINWTQIPTSEMTTKLNLSISSGEYPDIYTAPFSTDQVVQYGESGIFMPLEDLIEEHTVYIKQILEERPDIKEAITAPDGHIYTLFKTDPATYVLVRNKLYVNHDWLEAYCAATGKEAPVTTQEFEEMLIYWRDNDMNGNGDSSDEVPMVSTLATDGGDFTVYLMNAFQATPQSDYMLADEEGNVEMVAITDEYREGLKWINHLFEEGLIAEETFIQDNAQLMSLTNNNDPTQRTVGAFGGFWAGTSVNPSAMDNAYDVYDVLAPLEGPTGLRQATTDGHLPLELKGAIPVSCSDPVVAIKWLDWWFSNDGMVMIDYGFEDVNWEWNDTGDGNVAAMAGAEYELSEELQPASLNSIFANVHQEPKDYDAIHADFMRRVEAGEMDEHDIWGCNTWGTCVGLGRGRGYALSECYAINVGNNLNHVYPFDGSDNESRTQGEFEGRRSIARTVRWLNENVPGYEHTFVASVSPMVSARESRRILGNAYITREDYVKGVCPPDSVCYSFYPIDIHRGTEDAPLDNEYMAEGDVPGIPYGALVARGFDNLMMAGRIASGDRGAQSAFRVQASCMAMGEAAGTAAAMACAAGVSVDCLDTDALRRCLHDNGVIVPGYEE